MPQGGVRRALGDIVARLTGSRPEAGRPGEPAPTSTSQAEMMRRWQAVFEPGSLFSPGMPYVPEDAHRLRVRDFPVAVNYVYTPRAFEPINFAQLRGLADNHDITRLAIETRKDQIEGQNWIIKPIDPRAKASRATQDRIKAVTDFWLSPDGEQPFSSWLRAALEDLLVIDAPAFEVRRNRGGQVIGIDVLDGATFEPLVDETGRRPLAPAPAYLQVIRGRPWKLLTTDDIIYAPRNQRPHKLYGLSPVEEIVHTVNIGLRRQLKQLQHFTDGNIPAGFASVPESWNADQIQQYQEWFDSYLSGNTAHQTQLIWGPFGAKYQAFHESPYKDGFDEWLARIVCYAFSLPPTQFVTQGVQRTTADTLEEASRREGLAPLMAWVKRLADHVIQVRMGYADLEFSWEQENPLDPPAEAEMLDKYVRNGTFAVNEARARLGLDRVEGGDRPMVYLATGPVLLADIERDAESARQQAQAQPEPSPEPAAGVTPEPAGPKPGQTAKAARRSGGDIDGGDMRSVTLPVASDELRGEVEHDGWHAYENGAEPDRRTVPIADIVATQDEVDEAIVARHARHYRQHGSFGNPPLLLARDGKYYVLDGHHHIEGAIEAGAKDIEAQVITAAEAAEKAVKKTLYVSRRLKNADDLRDWAVKQGFAATLPAKDMHVTIAFSRQPVDWAEAGDDFDEIRVANGTRAVEPLGDEGAVVLRFASKELSRRWQAFLDAGASWDHDGYQPHVTIAYDGAPADLSAVEPYTGPLIFGPERFKEVDLGWRDRVVEEPAAKRATLSKQDAG